MAGYIWRPKYYRSPKEIPVPVQKNTTAAFFYHGADPVTYDNFNKRKSLKKNTLLSPAHRWKMRELPY